MNKKSEKILFKGKWLSLKENVFRNKAGEDVVWESVERRRSNLGAIVLARLVPSNRYILIRQFRIPINSYIIGFPAGLIDAKGIDKKEIEEEVLRELQEETGYTGKVIGSSPTLKANPGLVNDSFQIFNVEVDEESPQNIVPKQSLEPSEEIEVILKKREDIKNFLLDEIESGIEIGAGIWYLFGIEIFS